MSTPFSRPYRKTIVSISRLGRAMSYVVMGAALLNQLLTNDPGTILGRVFLATLISCIFLIAFIRLLILGLDLTHPEWTDPLVTRLRESTWSPFQSEQVRDLFAHLTPEEKDQLWTRQAQSGQRFAIFFFFQMCFVPFSLLFSMQTFLLVLGLFVVYAVVLVWFFIRDQQRRLRRTLCETPYAIERGYRPESVRLHAFPWSRKEIAEDPTVPA